MARIRPRGEELEDDEDDGDDDEDDVKVEGLVSALSGTCTALTFTVGTKQDTAATPHAT